MNIGQSCRNGKKMMRSSTDNNTLHSSYVYVYDLLKSESTWALISIWPSYNTSTIVLPLHNLLFIWFALSKIVLVLLHVPSCCISQSFPSPFLASARFPRKIPLFIYSLPFYSNQSCYFLILPTLQHQLERRETWVTNYHKKPCHFKELLWLYFIHPTFTNTLKLRAYVISSDSTQKIKLFFYLWGYGTKSK